MSGCGSSPLARGLPRHHFHRRRQDRIIPARAGFTVETDPGVRGLWDHPRSRGVYPFRRLGFSAVSGSSPLARGLQGVLLLGVEEVGIIPARAGFT